MAAPNSLERIEGRKGQKALGWIGQEAGYFGSNLQFWLREAKNHQILSCIVPRFVSLFTLLK